MQLDEIFDLHIIRDSEELEKAFAIRVEVFVDEQQVDPEIELDEFEDTATHVLALKAGQPVATARWRETDEGIKLERFAVLKTVRGQGIGRELVRFILRYIEPGSLVYLNSQVAAMGFYEKLGFVAEGDIFYEADIPHRRMTQRR